MGQKHVEIATKLYQARDSVIFIMGREKFMLKVDEDSILDEIATSRDVFGDDSENLTYMLFEANAKVLVNANFDITRIRELIIPNK